MPTRQQLANALRVLSIDAVEQAKSGHPGMPMGMADIAQVLWSDFLQHSPNNPAWLNRDRFVLSNGHGSMLLYALLHLTGYAVSRDDLRAFRQLHSITPGHPEYGMTPGVETSTGPLGQGVANAVGMALAQTHMAATFNRPGHEIIDHYTYVFLGDGCLMEGISHEVCSLAGTLKLGKLIAFWDDNGISIDGSTTGWFTDDTPARFSAYGWHTVVNVDGHDAEQIADAIRQAQRCTDKPSLICCRTIIGFGAPTMAGTADVHGSALGEQESAAARQALGWSQPAFTVPAEIVAAWNATAAGDARERMWQERFAAYKQAHPELAQELERRTRQQLPSEWQATVDEFIHKTQREGKTVATRKASLQCLNAFSPMLPELLGGSADLTGSNCTWHDSSQVLSSQCATGNYVHYGVREFGMMAMMNGIALYGGMIPYGGTFLTFVDYARNAVRMAALMRQRVILVLTHDSIGLGEDGPTHQPVEHLAMLRLTPNVAVWRPADAVETAVAWQSAIENATGPTCLALSRQNLTCQARNALQVGQIARGGYVLLDSAAEPQLILLATGSEVELVCQAAKALMAAGYAVRVVSMPCVEVFNAQAKEYQQQVLPPHINKRLVVEAGASAIWYQFVGSNGVIIGLDRYGESAPAAELFDYLGFSINNIVKRATDLIQAGE